MEPVNIPACPPESDCSPESDCPPEFSRKVATDKIPAQGGEWRIDAGPAECGALARRLGVIEIASLTADIRLRPLNAGGMVRLSGRLAAEVVQACVVTLAPVPARIEERFSMTFAEGREDEKGRAGKGGDGKGEIDLSFDDDPPDPIIDGAIDIGEAVAEHLALALDPFPRAPGAALDGVAEALPAEPAERNPFAVLAALRQKKG